MWLILRPLCHSHTWQAAEPITTWPPRPHSWAGSLPPAHTLPGHAWNTHFKHTRKTGRFGKHKNSVSDQLRGQPTYPQCQRLCSQEKSSFTVIQLTPASSENGENGAVFGHCYLGTFILITEALSNCCLVTNTFEIDLLTYYKML